MELLEEGRHRRRAGVGAFTRGGEDDAFQVARTVGRGEELPLAWAYLDEPTAAEIVEHDAGLAIDEVATREHVGGELGASGQRGRHRPRIAPERGGRERLCAHRPPRAFHRLVAERWRATYWVRLMTW